MVDCDGLKYHLKEHKFKYMMITMMLIFVIIGIILAAVGSHTLDTLMCAIGILLSIIFGIALIVYLCKICFFPNTNMCCEDPEWRTYGDI